MHHKRAIRQCKMAIKMVAKYSFWNSKGCCFNGQRFWILMTVSVCGCPCKQLSNVFLEVDSHNSCSFGRLSKDHDPQWVLGSRIRRDKQTKGSIIKSDFVTFPKTRQVGPFTEGPTQKISLANLRSMQSYAPCMQGFSCESSLKSI